MVVSFPTLDLPGQQISEEADDLADAALRISEEPA